MKILLLSPRNIFKGQGTAEPYYILRHFSARHLVTAIGPFDRHITHEYARILNISPHQPRWLSWLPYRVYLDFKILNTLIAEKEQGSNFDLIWSYNGLLITPIWLKLVKRCSLLIDLRVPPVEQQQEFHASEGRISILRRLYWYVLKKLHIKALSCADLVVTVSQELNEFIIAEYSVPPSKIYVQTLGVDLKHFKRFRELSHKSTEAQLIYVSSIRLRRGIDTVIRALAELQGERIYPRLTIVGSGPEDEVSCIQDLAHSQGVSQQIEWLGQVSHNDIPHLLRNADIGLSPLPNLQSYRMSSPTKVFEYLAMGLVVLASDIPAHRAIIVHRSNGLLIPAESHTAWARALKEVTNSESLRDHLQNRARRSVETFDWDRMLSLLEKRVMRL